MIKYEIWIAAGESTMTLAYDSSNPDDYPVFNPKYKIEVNSIGEMSFIMGADHPLINSIREMKTIVCVIQKYVQNGITPSEQLYCPFAGRIFTIEEDENQNKQVTCEGALGFLNDYYERKKFFLIPTSQWHSTGSDVYGGNAIEQALVEEMNYHIRSNSIEGAAGDYPYVNNQYSFTSDYASSSALNNPEKLTNGFETGPVLYSNYTSGSSDFSDIENGYCTAYEAVFNEILKKSGGILLPSYVPIFDSNGKVDEIAILVCYKAYDFSQTGGAYGFVFPYPEEVSSGYDYSRFDWLPRFDKGYNVLRLNKESSLKTKYSGIVPVGKNSNGDFYLEYPTNMNGKYLFNSNLVSEYGAHIAIPVRFETASTQSELMSMGEYWLSRHSRDIYIPRKYTITGPEPCELGYGSVPIMLMRDVLIREDTSDSLENSSFYPCLSMEIDIQNAQNNTYVIGPYIDDMYTDTTISGR